LRPPHTLAIKDATAPTVELAAKTILTQWRQDRLGTMAKLYLKTMQAVLEGLS